MLDALGKSEGRSVMDYLPKGLCEPKRSVWCNPASRYPKKNRENEPDHTRSGDPQVKVKMGRNLTQNQSTLQTVCSVLDKDRRLKVDVNGAWDRETALSHLSLIEHYHVEIVEQPMAPGALEMAEVSDRLKASDVENHGAG